MVSYKDAKSFNRSSSTEFDAIHKPGDPTPHSGIYKCQVCGYEAASVEPHPLPPQSDCIHNHPAEGILQAQRPVRWKLVAAAKHLK